VDLKICRELSIKKSLNEKNNNMRRIDAVIKFYEVLYYLEKKIGGKRTLGKCNGRMDWPERGVYFFFEEGESRIQSGRGQKVVRIGTHALEDGVESTLWKRLRMHRGSIAVHFMGRKAC